MGIVTTATDKFRNCVDACLKCTQACYECIGECLKEPDLNKRRKCITGLIECAMMCQMSIAFMSMNSQDAYDHCELCGKICKTCAMVCADMEVDHCKKCAEICKMCADECIKMASI